MPGLIERFQLAIQAIRGLSVPVEADLSTQVIEPMVGETFFKKDVERYNPGVLLSRKRPRIIDQMMLDDQVKASMTLKQQAPISGEWSVMPASEDLDHITHAGFITDNFNLLRGTFKDCLYAITDALPYGYSVQEMVFHKMVDTIWKGKMMLAKVVHHAPHNLTWIYDDESKEMVGVEQTTSGDILPFWKAIIYRWDAKWDNPWGNTDLGAAYRAWYSKDWTIRHWNIMLERVALQRLVATYEDGYSTMANDAIDDWVRAVGIAKPEGVDIDFVGGGSDAKASSDTFQKAIQIHDQAITRSILKQTLATQEGARVGSMALGKIHQDTLAMELAGLQLDIEEVVNEQIIRFLIDLNFGKQDDYPSFHLPDLFPEDPHDFIEAYTKLLNSGGMVVTKADEDRMREIVGLPEREGDDAPPGKQKQPNPIIPDEDEEDDDKAPFQLEAFKTDRPLSKSGKRANVKRLGRERAVLETQAVADFTAIMDLMEERLLTEVGRRFFKDGLANPAEANKIKVAHVGDIKRLMRSSMEAWAEKGAADLRESVAKAGFAAVNPGGLSMKQQQAALEKNLAAKAEGIATDVKGEVERDVRNVLLKAMENGETQAATTLKLKQIFEKWQVGSTVPGGEFSPWRIETIIRTNFTTAYSNARLIAARDPDLADFILAFEYVALLDQRTTDICNGLDGLVLSADDPRVDTIKEPNHFSCRGLLVEMLVGDEIELSSDAAIASAISRIPSAFR